MNYEYKMEAVPQSFTCKYGIDLKTTLAQYVEERVNLMANDGWEFYNSESFGVLEKPGCFSSLFGASERMSYYNVLVFRREK